MHTYWSIIKIEYLLSHYSYIVNDYFCHEFPTDNHTIMNWLIYWRCEASENMPKSIVHLFYLSASLNCHINCDYNVTSYQTSAFNKYDFFTNLPLNFIIEDARLPGNHPGVDTVPSRQDVGGVCPSTVWCRSGVGHTCCIPG